MSKHRNVDLTPFQTVRMFSQRCQRFRFEHPFTSMIAGMTGSGKTAWVRSLLQQASEPIYPPPERIVWCYSQWEPGYTQMLVAMPHIEFVKGIPTALEQDAYFDVNKRNLIVFDDQEIDASKDKRIVNLFTRGSHHRNLSVIYIVQNLFHQGKGSRSISLNSHYLVLFKNPRDKLQILTLAKQIKRYFQLQNRYLAFKEQLNTRTRPEEIISTVPDLTSRTQDSSTATTAFSTPLNPFNVTPELTQAAISQKPDKESLTPPPPLNPAFLTPPPTARSAKGVGFNL
ncbi:unnamed protein product [Porites evermanni]|uniref:Zona occludens toxin N-terminal domain-containing protein n=1 Tax=Porites evermanni TaxID=104178 RepID=A0ABN8T314_9CNID|nr:unnamed protein product [Porites evermanni]